MEQKAGHYTTNPYRNAISTATRYFSGILVILRLMTDYSVLWTFSNDLEEGFSTLALKYPQQVTVSGFPSSSIDRGT